MARLTRQESQERTRRLLIEAASKLFLRDGFRATSLEAIGEEAGYSRGAVYSNFGSKTEIGFAVVDRLYQQALANAVEAVAEVADQSPNLWVHRLAEAMRGSIGDPKWARLELELSADAGVSEQREVNATRYATLRNTCSMLLIANAKSRNIPLTVDPDLLGLTAVSVVIGMGIQRACDPTLSGDLIEPVLRLLTDRAFGSAD